MINLSEFLTQGSLFTAINNVEPFPFIDNPLIMDKLLSLEHGDKTVFGKMIMLSMPEIAEMIVTLNGDDWKNQVLIDSGDFETGASVVKKLTETINNTENKTNSRDDLNKVSGFNSDELIVNDGSTSNGQDDTTGETIRTLVDSTIDLETAYKNLSLSKKNNIMNTVLNDVASFITLSIY